MEMKVVVTHEGMPALLQVAGMLLIEHPADDQMAFLTCFIARLAKLNMDNPEMKNKYEIGKTNLESTINFLQAIKKDLDAIPDNENNEESSECQH